MFVCLYVCVSVCLCVCISLCICVTVYLCICTSMCVYKSMCLCGAKTGCSVELKLGGVVWSWSWAVQCRAEAGRRSVVLSVSAVTGLCGFCVVSLCCDHFCFALKGNFPNVLVCFPAALLSLSSQLCQQNQMRSIVPPDPHRREGEHAGFHQEKMN